jgi:ribonuclease P protein component
MEPTREQAHLPAQQPPPGQDPRLPAAHAHAGRTGHPRRASAQGPQPAVGLTVTSAPAAASSAVLPRPSRLTRAADFTEVVRGGRRAGRPLLTVHADLPAAGQGPPRAGLVVGRGVGGSVVRSRTSRRLRHLLRRRIGDLPAGSRLVVRAAPAAGTATSAALARDLDAALARLLTPARSER